MQSNSKLNMFEKALLKDLRAAYNNVRFAQMGKTTVAFARVGNLVEFSTAICADNEKKNRPKVGKFYALTRFDNKQTVKMQEYDFDCMIAEMYMQD